MKVKNKVLIYFMVLICIIILLTTSVKAQLSDLSVLIGTGSSNIGNVYNLSYLSVTSNNRTYCIQHGKKLRNAEEKYILKNYVEIDGKEARVYSTPGTDCSIVVDNLNAEVAYILNRQQGYGTSANPTDAQKALWYLTNSWTTKIFGNTIYSWEQNSRVSRNYINDEAEAYAEKIGNLKAADVASSDIDLKVVDKTDKSSLSVREVDNYYRVGPFRWEFDGTLKEIQVIGDIGTVSSSNVRLIKYTGTTEKAVNASEILTGEAFYVDVDKSTGIYKLTGLRLKTDACDDEDTMEIYIAKIWFLQSSKYQNLIYVDLGCGTGSKIGNGLGEGNYNVIFASNLEIIKVDDRDNEVPLAKVGFTFKATIQTLDKVGEKEHTKNIACTHVKREAYTDSSGVKHSTEYEHKYDVVYDWTEYLYEWKDHTMYLNGSGNWSESEYIHYTDDDGKITIGRISYPTKEIKNQTSAGSSFIISGRLKAGTDITATEVSNPYYGYSIGNTYSVNINHSATISSKIIDNHQDLVKLSGYVWIEQNDGKANIRDDEYGSGDEAFNGMMVYLRDTSGNEIKRTTTSELGLYSEINGGEYQFVDVDLDELQAGKYYIEFEYCGITYQSVAAKIDQTNGSKAIDTTTRNILDSKFSSVDGTGTQTLNINGVVVNYNDINDYSSSVNNHSGCNVYARTNEAGYDLYSDFEPTMEEIRYINLGVFIKPQTDFAITQDLYNVRVEVNGFSHIYRYASVRYNKDGSVDEDSSWNVGVKFQKNSGSYDRAIYKSDTEYETPNHRDNELKVYVTYKLAMKNESSYLGRINKLVEYCDNRFELIGVGTTIDEKDNIGETISTSAKTPYDSEYSSYIIDVNSVLNSLETKYIYVQYRLDRTAVLTILNNNELINNVAEIYSYTTFKENNIDTPVSVIDIDSVPGNIKPGTTDTYEDDTDAARSLKLELKNERALAGTVFVDSTGKDSNIVYTGEERKGNGIYDGGEQTIAGIPVKLHEIGKDDSSYDGERVEMETLTDENGNFEFRGYVPGNYILTYTWGNETYKVQYYKGTIYDESRDQSNTYWYKDSVDIRKTDALDDSSIRKKIDNEMKALKYNTLESEINKAYKDGSSYITQTSMESSTPTMSFSVEYDTTITDGTKDEVIFTVKNVDYGIVERPKQQLEFSKRVSGYKITLANGQILVDAQISEDGKVTGTFDNSIYMKPNVDFDGLIRTEIDNELIEGATLETTYTMKVTNIGELDYTSDKYYYYGNNNGSDKVKVSVTGLIDYLDGRLSILDDKWEEKDKKFLEEVNASQKDNEEYLNSTRTYLTSTLSKELAPGESNTTDLHASKLLTSTDDNTFDNQSEIVEVTKSNGFNTGTPVKAIWIEDKFHFNANNSEKIAIIPSTGENKQYTLPIIVGITTLLILGTGIIVIKKFIIDNK